MIRLTDFRNPAVAREFDADRGEWHAPVDVKSEPALGAVGFAEHRFVGLWSRQSVNCALYTDTHTIWFRVGNFVADLQDPGVRVSRRTIVPFVKRFRIQHSGRVALDLWYWWADVHEWPDDDVLDIFLYVAVHFGKQSDCQNFVRLWSLTGKGLTAEEAHRAISAEDRARGGRTRA